jgi:hypothetical protein
MRKHIRVQEEEQGNRQRSEILADLCYRFLKPILVELNGQIDRRLVRTFLALVIVIITHRHRNQGLLLSELGGYLMPPAQAPAGTKRLSRLLLSRRWKWQVIERFLWRQADQRIEELRAQGEPALVVWDGSVIEKPESLKLEGLGAVRSTKAARLKRIKPGYFNPPGGRPIFVPGFQWLSVIVLGRSGQPTLAHMRWWTTRGKQKTDRRTIEDEVLAESSWRWGQQVIHVLDRGFAGRPWLLMASVHAVRFVMRWPKHYRLRDDQGQLRKAWQITRGKRSWSHRLLFDARRRCHRKVGVVAVPVSDPDHDQELYLVVARPGKGREPWYLLTSEPVHNDEDAWRIVLFYARRWQVEMSLRFSKCELAFESLRVQGWHTRQKLLLIATLAYAFLLSLLHPVAAPLKQWLLSHWCHRTGKRSRETPTPLYRLRMTLSRLWMTHPPPYLGLLRSG